MREVISVPAGKLHRSEALSTDQLALVETLGIGSHAVERAGLAAGESVLVIGCGPIGLSVVQFAQLAGARLSVLDLICIDFGCIFGGPRPDFQVFS